VKNPTVEQLRAIDLFDDLDDAEVQRFAQDAELRQLPPGAVVAEQGKPQGFHLLLAGSLDLAVVDPAGQVELVSQQVAPTWIGAIVVVTGGVSGVSMRTATDVTIAEIRPEAFIELVLAHRPVFDRVMRQVRPVVGRITALEQNRERLASLGTMAAGLAHELNNPAAAARRAAADLADALDVLGSTIGSFVESGVEREEAQELVELQRQALAQRDGGESRDALAEADAEDELLEALEEIGIPEAWRLTEPLASARVDGAWLRRVRELAGPATPAALRWVAASLTATNLTSEIAESTQRMSALVAAVKSYAYMDRGELVDTDIHEGIDTTLTVLGHKLKHTAIEVVRRYDRSMPNLTVRGGELNQVWTNLIDNAIYALGDGGTITISTSLDGPCVRVDVADDGPGIAPDVRAHIFDPFFTTKDVGQGTGLGLDTVRRIVAERNGGTITVDSEPGRTVFHVWLPLQQPKPAPAESDGVVDPGFASRSDRKDG
jgi:signal transduction histidine kinase